MKKHESMCVVCRVLTLECYVMYKYTIFNLSFKIFFILFYFHTMNFNELRLAFVLRASAYTKGASAYICCWLLSCFVVVILFASFQTVIVCILLIRLRVLYHIAVLLLLCVKLMNETIFKENIHSWMEHVKICAHRKLYAQWKEGSRFGDSVLTVDDKQ